MGPERHDLAQLIGLLVLDEAQHHQQRLRFVYRMPHRVVST
ncbi:hypothetical protein ACIRST_40515 [Kitasatospora sp. NPDC101447]